MHKFILLVCLLLNAADSFSQAGNLVPNGDFEDGSSPYCVGQAYDDYIDYWYSNQVQKTEGGGITRYHSPDLYEGGTFLNPNDPLCNSLSYSAPLSGAYSGNRSIGMGSYELIQTEIAPMTPGKYYTLSFYIQPKMFGFSDWTGKNDLVVKLSRQKVEYVDCGNCDYETELKCSEDYVTHKSGISQEFFELGRINLDIDNYTIDEWQRVSFTFRANEHWDLPTINRAVWLSIEMRLVNFTDQTGTWSCFDDFIYIDNVRLEESTFCNSQCSPSLQPITYSTDPVNYNSTLPNGMTAEGYAIIGGNFLTPFTLYVKDAMGIDLAIYDDQWQYSIPLVTISAFDPNGLQDVGYNDYQFFWDGQLPDGSFLPQDTYFYTIRMWSCESDLFLPDNDIQYFISNTTFMDVPNILNSSLKNCCDDNEVYNNITFSNDFRKDVTDYIIAGDIGPVTVTSGTTVEFYAGNDIILGPNFNALSGSDFTAYLQDCIYGPKSLQSSKQRIEIPTSSSITLISDKLEDIRIINSITNDGSVGYKLVGLSDITSIKILDLGGNIISQGALYNTKEGKIDFSNYSNGVYFIIFETTSGYVSTKKIVVSK
jgi:hypothetical protein